MRIELSEVGEQSVEARFQLNRHRRWASLVLSQLDAPEVQELAGSSAPGDAAVIDLINQVRHVAIRLTADRLPSYSRLNAMLLERRLRRLTFAVTGCSNPRKVAGALKDVLMRPSHTTAQFREAVKYFRDQNAGLLSTAHMVPVASKLGVVPPNRLGPLHEIAAPPGSGCPFDEAMIMYRELSELREEVKGMASEVKTRSGEMFYRQHLKTLSVRLYQLRSEMLIALDRSAEGEPVMIDEDPAALRSLVAASTLVIRHFGHGREDGTLIGNAEKAGHECIQAIRETSGVNASDAALLPTLTRSQFEALFPATVDCDNIRGAYIPYLKTVVLSPGHAQLVCSPTPRRFATEHGEMLLPVHLHELAHASANNGEAAADDPVEAALAEGYAEVVAARAIPEAQRRLSELHDREISYRRHRAYPIEEDMFLEIMTAYAANEETAEPQRKQFLRWMASSRSMVPRVEWLLYGTQNDDRQVQLSEAMASYLIGDPYPLRRMLAQARRTSPISTPD